jgi:hypothetical protein
VLACLPWLTDPHITPPPPPLPVVSIARLVVGATEGGAAVFGPSLEACGAGRAELRRLAEQRAAADAAGGRARAHSRWPRPTD